MVGRAAAVETATAYVGTEHYHSFHKPQPTEYQKTVPASFADRAKRPALREKNINAADYVGQDTCKGCHEDVFKGWEMTPHWRTTLDTHKGPEWQGCEACHGPGKAHVDAEGEASGDVLQKLKTGKAAPRTAGQGCAFKT